MRPDTFSQHQRFTQVGDTQVAYLDQGDGPPLLLLHGCPFSCFVWRKTIPLLSARYRCIAPDLLGLGDTQTAPEADWSLPAQAATVLGLLDALQIDAAHLVGHDHGAAVAQLLAAHHPDRLRRLVITNAEAYDNWPSHQELPFLRLAQLPLVGAFALWAWSKRPVLQLALRTGRAVHNPAVLTPELLDGYIRANLADRQRRAKTRRFLAGQLDPANQRHTLAALPGLRRFDHPTLLIWGRDDPHFGPQWAQRLHADIPGAPTSSSSSPPPAISSWRSNPNVSPRSSPTSSPSPAAHPPHRPPAPHPAAYQHPNHRSCCRPNRHAPRRHPPVQPPPRRPAHRVTSSHQGGRRDSAVTQLARQLFGLPIPDEGALFDVALAGHITAGLTCVITGALAATAPKRPGRHPTSGRVYFWSLAVVFASSTTMAVLRFAQDWHLLAIGTVAFGAGTLGYLARRRRRPGWLRIHIPAMGGSYIALLTGFYVDNGPHLPLWDRLPILGYWLLPSLVGVPLILRAMTRRHLLSVSQGRRGRPHSGAQPGRPG